MFKIDSDKQMFKIDLDKQMWILEQNKNKVLKSYLKNGRTIEEFERNYKDRFYPTFCYDKDGKLIKEGYFNENGAVRIR